MPECIAFLIFVYVVPVSLDSCQVEDNCLFLHSFIPSLYTYATCPFVCCLQVAFSPYPYRFHALLAMGCLALSFWSHTPVQSCVWHGPLCGDGSSSSPHRKDGSETLLPFLILPKLVKCGVLRRKGNIPGHFQCFF